MSKLNTVNQTDLIAKLADKVGLTKIKTKEILESLGEIVLSEMKDQNIVTMPVLGRFTPKTTKARSCRNPRTGEIMQVPEKSKMAFAASAKVKETLENGKKK